MRQATEATMKPINEREFAVYETPVTGEHLRVLARATRGLAALSGVFRIRDDPDRLPARLRRDAGLDELDIERRRIATAPLIR
jgi:hypothetical protein